MTKSEKQTLGLFIGPLCVVLTATAVLILIFGRDHLFLAVNSVHHPLADTVFTYITLLGDGWLYFILLIFFAFKSQKWLIHAAMAFLISFIFSRIGKDILFNGAYRPKKYFESIEVPIRTIEGLQIHEYNTFPSGHTIIAFSLFLILSLYFQRSSLTVFFLSLALLAGFSRIYLAQHFPTDVFAGAIMGVFATLLSYLWVEQFRKKQPNRFKDNPLIKIGSNA